MSKSNLTITFTIICVMLVAFSLVYLVNDWHRSQNSIDKIKANWYKEHLDSQEKTIYIIGSSHVWSLNSTHIEKTLFRLGYDYKIYNLAAQAEGATTHLRDLDKVISSNPDVVILSVPYTQILYQDDKKSTVLQTSDKYHDTFFPHPLDLVKNYKINNLKSFDLLNFKNPKLTSLEIINNISDEPSKVYDLGTNEPFIWRGAISKINVDKKRMELPIPFFPLENFPSAEHPNVLALKKMVNKYKENGIKIIVFVTPYHDLFWEKLDASQEEKFLTIIKNLESDLELKIYDLHNKYSDMKIWNDVIHVARNPDSLIYTEDMTKIIIKELES